MAVRQMRAVAANIKNSALVEERRELIIRAAIDVFLEKGFHAATTRDVCIRAGLTQGTLYNYIRSKDDILYLVCDQAIGHYYDAVEAALADITDPRERLVRAIRATVRSQVEHRDHIQIVVRDAPFLQAESRAAVRARADGFFDRIQGLLAEALPDGPLRVASTALLAEFVTYLPTMAAMRRWRLRHTLSPEQVAEGLIELILRGLGIDGAGAPTQR